MQLYFIDKLIEEIAIIGIDDDGVIIPEFDELLEKLKMDRSKKFENIGKFVKNLESDIDAIKTEKQRLSLKQKICENKVERLKGFVKNSMEKHNNKTYKAGIFEFSFRKSSSLNIDNIDLIPDEFKRVTIEANKSDIKAAMKLGTEFKGVSISENQNLVIK
ncbi:MAG: siphovirus Gp157 family protein [Candidatus Gracilibacteria bacterium]|nr:siphovirus Gp157 family protein [Candidatus Gracilibacteria bacterium]